MKVHAHIVVQGIVQGVGFRYFVLQHAQTFQVEGYVRNLLSSDVEIEIQGDKSSVEALVETIKVGPRYAHISNIIIDWLAPVDTFSGFEVWD